MIEKLTTSPVLRQSNYLEEKRGIPSSDSTVQDQLSIQSATTMEDQNDSIRLEKEQLEKIVEKFNDFIPSHTSLKFELHEKLEKYYVKVIDDETKDVIKEIPSKKMLDMYSAMKEFLGLMVDEKI